MVQGTRSGAAAARKNTPVVPETQPVSQPTAQGIPVLQPETGRAQTLSEVEESDVDPQDTQDRQLEGPSKDVSPETAPQFTLPNLDTSTDPTDSSRTKTGEDAGDKSPSPLAADEPEDPMEKALASCRQQLALLQQNGIGMDRVLGKSKTKGQKKSEKKKKEQKKQSEQKKLQQAALEALIAQGVIPSMETSNGGGAGGVVVGGAGGDGGSSDGSSDGGDGGDDRRPLPPAPRDHGHSRSRSRSSSFVDIVSPGTVSAAQYRAWMADPEKRDMGKAKKPAHLEKYPPKGGLQGHRDWVNRAERIFRTSWYYFPDELSKIDHAALALEGNHATRWNDKETDGKTKHWSFYRFQEFLMSINMDAESRSLVAASDYLKAWQGEKQTVTEFYSWINALENQLPKLPDEWRKIMFLLRLRDKLQERCRVANNKLSDLTVEQWVETATRHETIMQGEGSTLALNSGGHHGGGKSNSNSNQNSGKRKRDNEPVGAQSRNNNRGSSKPSGGGGGGNSGGNSGGRSGGKSLWCFNCGKNDHISPNCTSQPNPDLVKRRKDNEARTGAVHTSSKNDRPAAKRPRQTGQ
ncbi:MAG: hypothetical protein LQ350_008635 [Teloschistes chrysophthalmus]|nr:MAG: hypothetical protein LQ350_008635 [Niorma chrysophthalma]